MTLSRSKKRAFALVLSAITGALIVLSCELMLRWREHRFIQSFRDAGEHAGVIPSDIPGLNYTLRPHYQYGDIQFNEHGFNMVSREADKPAGIYRLFFVGDSVTQGVGIGSTPEAFPNLIDRLIADRLGDPAVEVWNAGVGGYNAEQVLLLMQHVLPAFSPNAIIYTFNFNDYWEPNQYFHGQPGIPPDELQERGKSGLLDRLKQFRTILFLRDHYNKLAFRMRGYAPVYVDQKTDYPSWAKMKSIIDEMNRYCAANQMAFAVVVHPNKQFLHVRPEANRAHRDILDFLVEHNITHLDLLPALKPQRDQGIYLDDGNHMTPAGYTLMANAIMAWLVDASILPSPISVTP